MDAARVQVGAGMQVRVGVEPAGEKDDASLASLFRWLQRDRQLLTDAELQLVPGRDPDAQGGLFEVINAVIGDAVGLGGWRCPSLRGGRRITPLRR